VQKSIKARFCLHRYGEAYREYEQNTKMDRIVGILNTKKGGYNHDENMDRP
jgi:hypothetical protein